MSFSLTLSPYFSETKHSLLNMELMGSGKPNLSVSASQCWATNAHWNAWLLGGFWGSKLRSFCFHTKQFSNWSIYPALLLGTLNRQFCESVWNELHSLSWFGWPWGLFYQKGFTDTCLSLNYIYWNTIFHKYCISQCELHSWRQQIHEYFPKSNLLACVWLRGTWDYLKYRVIT